MTFGAYLAHRGGHRCGHRHGDGGTVPDGCGIARRHPASPATAGAACGRASRKGEVSAVLASFGSHGNAGTSRKPSPEGLVAGRLAGACQKVGSRDRPSWRGATVRGWRVTPRSRVGPTRSACQSRRCLQGGGIVVKCVQPTVMQKACAEGLRASRPDSCPDSRPVSQLASHRAFVLEGIKVSSVAAARRPFGVPPLPLHALRQGCTRRQCCTP